ncbi:mitochondrial import inner membrane translocase subunit TIM10-like isoform X2 [Spinacia oleracea]|uniref:Mitochondrial import inner membrane translocase subunit n=1 Tax=Spinacia oleracea TaxID=3562 RepID=A0ABM3QML1_SPIOL|nr:mitochondrial import inner membrane translocase subunit TIM10-like isoform X2 [Spinacia oleracea]XP_056684607.1 mitochondrial import inner membrane translocase subunit TIM10-like isoform X2 [Spinacia oleracea]
MPLLLLRGRNGQQQCLFYCSEARDYVKFQIKLDDIKAVLDKEKVIGTTISDMEYRVALFNSLTHTCFEKCVEKRYKEGELHLGENSCIDRCVSKYWQVNNLVGHLLAYGRRGV